MSGIDKPVLGAGKLLLDLKVAGDTSLLLVSLCIMQAVTQCFSGIPIKELCVTPNPAILHGKEAGNQMIAYG